jgi:predicted neuraminidase
MAKARDAPARRFSKDAQFMTQFVARVIVVCGYLVVAAHGRLHAVEPALPPDAVRDPARWAEAIVSRGFVFGELPTPSCHASTIVEASPGTFVVAWFGGQHEGAADVGIWLSRLDGGTWTRPAQVAVWHDPDGRQRPCWNPVLARMPDGSLALYYKASGSPQTWNGRVLRSIDGGKTWSEPESIEARPGSETTLVRVPVGPIKNKPVVLSDGAILAPSSTEDAGWRVHFERSADGGKTWQVIGPVNDGAKIGAIQPSILQLGGTRLLAIGRTQNKRVFRVESPDNGLTWSQMTLLDVPNPNSGTDAVSLADGRHLLIYNHSEKERWPLNVAVSVHGTTWTPAVTIEAQPGEFSYPAMIQAADGTVHVTYTWNRKKIAYAVLDPAKIIASTR